MIVQHGTAGKQERQAIIAEAIRNGSVATQEQLLDRLRKEGLAATQSTLSRDLAELGVRKARGQYVFAAAEETEDRRLNYADVVLRFTTCGPHMIVVNTGQGQAPGVALAIDGASDPAIVSTLAGDDTIFIATRNRRTQTVALRRLQQWFGDKHER